MTRFSVGFDIQGTFEVHAKGCPDVERRRRNTTRKKGGRYVIVQAYSWIEEREAETPTAALDAALRGEFSDASEHPETGGFPGGSFGAAGFDGRVLPCCERRAA